jgi:hypothetical protein
MSYDDSVFFEVMLVKRLAFVLDKKGIYWLNLVKLLWEV